MSADGMDFLWANGWRHFGEKFYRYNAAIMGGQLQRIVPLRTVLSKFKQSKSQRRVIRKNGDLRMVMKRATLDDEKWRMFEAHRLRFDEYIPTSLHNFLSEQPDRVPCLCLEFGVRDPQDRLLAVSFLDVGKTSVSSVFAMFDPEFQKRRLGILTMLLEIYWAQQQGKQYYYSGYTTTGSSRYDYKKCFHGLEGFDFDGKWEPFERQCS